MISNVVCKEKLHQYFYQSVSILPNAMSKALSLLVLRECHSCPEEGQSVSMRSRVDTHLVQQDWLFT